jgi:Pla-1/cef family extracellular lipase
MAISAASGLPAPGLRDLSSLFPVDVERHITKFNPVPAPSAPSDMPWIGDPGTLEVQMTTPDIVVANAVRSSLNLPPLVKPDNGWPVVMLQHGITTNKESMLLITGALSIQGLATVAIDFPMHGSRGFDVNGDGVDDLNASISALFFANLASLPTARDNLKQAQADMLGLRFGLNFIGGVDPLGNPMDLGIDSSTVTFLGSSFGAMNGMNFVAFANTSLDPALDGMFEVKAASLNVPGAMFANFGIESPAFEVLAKSNLTLQASPDFQALVNATYPDGADASQLGALYVQFYSALSAEQQAGLDAVFAQFTFAAETLLDSGDPISSIALLAASQTPIHLTEVIGNGVDNLPDQVVTNTAPFTPMGGTDPIITLLGLPVVSTTLATADGSPVSGAVRFLYGSHGSALSPAHTEGVTASPEYAARATVEMQSQIGTFLATQGEVIFIVDEEIIE